MIASGLERVAARFETELSPLDLRRWAREACAELAGASVGSGAEDAELSRDTAEIFTIARAVFSGIAFPEREFPVPPHASADLEHATRWLRTVAAHRKVTSDPLPARLGASLETFEDDPELALALEVLLRHVEVRHDECLAHWIGAHGRVDADHERLGVAILFMKTTARTGDLRFLNAGLKLIDWFGMRYVRDRRAIPVRIQRRALRATLECLAGLDRVGVA